MLARLWVTAMETLLVLGSERPPPLHFHLHAGLVNTEMQKRADDHREGRNPVVASNHILLLNFNEGTPALLQNIACTLASSGNGTTSGLDTAAAADGAGAAGARRWGRPPVVVLLADNDKAEMDAAVQEAIR